MENVNKELKEKNIEFVNVETADINGILRGKKTHVDYFLSKQNKGIAMPIGAMFVQVNGHFQSPPPIENYVGDGFMYPDPSTFVRLPWDKNTACVYSDFKVKSNDFNGPDYANSTRAICKSQVTRLGALGYQLMSAFESEFSVADKDKKPLVCAASNYATSTQMSKFSKLSSDIMKNLIAVGIKPEIFHNEMDASSYELTYSPSFGISGADDAVNFKKIVKETCQTHDLTALFLTVPFPECEGGNYRHFNMSVWDREGKTNLFYDAARENNLSTLALNWIGGLQEHAAALNCLGSPTVNCYQKLLGETCLNPMYDLWGIDNRTVCFRVKSYSEESTYIENRMTSPMCNPYLVIAGCIIAGIDGIQRNLQPTPPFAEDAYAKPLPNIARKLPQSLEEALKALDDDQLFKEQLGEEFVKVFLHVKQEEIQVAKNQLNKWSWYLDYFGEFI